MSVESNPEFTHFDENGKAKMVDVGEKPVTRRTATAAGRVLVNRSTFNLIRTGGVKKGDVLTVAQVAGIMAAKHTSDLIPMCHPVITDGIDMRLALNEDRLSVEIEATVLCDGRTGVEMEALTAVSAAALTVYDMCKAVQRDIQITDIALVKKTGGIHGDYARQPDDANGKASTDRTGDQASTGSTGDQASTGGTGSADCPASTGGAGMPSMERWLKEAKSASSAAECGMYLFHNGIVRASPKAKVRSGADTDAVVEGMDLSCDPVKADAAARETEALQGIHYVRVWLNSGHLSVGDPIMLVLVGGDIRPNVVRALQFLVDKLKRECVTETELY